jgi:DNA-binding CsgD family transcriptional regulator
MHTKKVSFSSYFTRLQHFSVADVVHLFGSRLTEKDADIGYLVKIINDKTDTLLKLNAFVIIEDLHKMSFVYVSPSIEPVLGYTAEEFLEGNASFFIKCYCPADRVIGETILYKIVGHQKTPDLPDKASYQYHNTYRFLHKNGYYKWMYNRWLFVDHDEKTNPHVAISIVSGINPFKKDDNIQFACSKYNPVLNSYETEYIEDYKPDYLHLLNKTDLEILRLMAKGLDNARIAEKMNFSEHTIKDYRKKMLRKTWCDNMAELLCFALRNKLV